MNALLALALFSSPLRAGVVVPVESAVAPAGPSAPVVPVGAPAGGLIGAPSFGGIDLRGGLPLLPSPVPGLIGPALNFVGNTAPEAAAVRPEAAAAPAAPAPSAVRGRRADQTPALPAKVSPGAPALAISRDRNSAGSAPGNGASSSRAARDEAASNPLVETASLEHARPEKAAGLGRKFFDQSSDENRGEIADGAAADSGEGKGESSVIAQRGAGSPAFGGGYGPGVTAGGLAAYNGGASVGGDRGEGRTNVEGEPLRDALASVPGAAAPRGAVSFFRSAAPNGNLSAPAGAAGTAVFGFPRPLALDLSPSGLIVRVRSALSGVIDSAPASGSVSPLPTPGPSTALLERGGMLEAFSVARAHAESAVAQSISVVKSPRAGAPRAATPFAPSPVSRSAPSLWWALLALPLFVAGVRGIL